MRQACPGGNNSNHICDLSLDILHGETLYMQVSDSAKIMISERIQTDCSMSMFVKREILSNEFCRQRDWDASARRERRERSPRKGCVTHAQKFLYLI